MTFSSSPDGLLEGIRYDVVEQDGQLVPINGQEARGTVDMHLGGDSPKITAAFSDAGGHGFSLTLPLDGAEIVGGPDTGAMAFTGTGKLSHGAIHREDDISDGPATIVGVIQPGEHSGSLAWTGQDGKQGSFKWGVDALGDSPEE